MDRTRFGRWLAAARRGARRLHAGGVSAQQRLHFAALLIVLAAPLRAQEFRATLSGAVSDPSGGTVPNAVVTALENSTRLSYTGRTNSAGRYYIPYVLPGTYTMTVEAKGFRTFIQKNVTVTTAQSQGLISTWRWERYRRKS